MPRPARLTIPGTSKSGLSTGGGGGGGKSAPAPAPVPVNPQPLVVAPLTFTAAAPVNGVLPQCSGDYRIDPYYPTLSLMTVNVQPSSVNVPDGTTLYIAVNVTGGTGYPFTSNAVVIAGQTGLGSLSEYITPGSSVSVTITDASGAVVFSGK